MNFKSALLLPLSLMALSITAQALDMNTRIALQNAERKYGINENLLIAMSKVESKHNQYAIGTMTNGLEQLRKLKEYLELMNINYGRNGKKNVSVYPKNLAEAKLVFSYIDRHGINYDLGLMQINKYNVEKRGLDTFSLLDNINYNLAVGATILIECAAYNGRDTLSSLECYNKGTDRKKYDNSYAYRVINEYYKLYANEVR